MHCLFLKMSLTNNTRAKLIFFYFFVFIFSSAITLLIRFCYKYKFNIYDKIESYKFCLYSLSTNWIVNISKYKALNLYFCLAFFFKKDFNLYEVKQTNENERNIFRNSICILGVLDTCWEPCDWVSKHLKKFKNKILIIFTVD